MLTSNGELLAFFFSERLPLLLMIILVTEIIVLLLENQVGLRLVMATFIYHPYSPPQGSPSFEIEGS